MGEEEGILTSPRMRREARGVACEFARDCSSIARAGLLGAPWLRVDLGVDVVVLCEDLPRVRDERGEDIRRDFAFVIFKSR